MSAPVMEMKWSEKSERPNDTEYCACCDRFVAPESRHTVEVSGDMSLAIHPDHPLDPNHSGGAFTVGPDCAKKYLNGFAVRRGY